MLVIFNEQFEKKNQTTQTFKKKKWKTSVPVQRTWWNFFVQLHRKKSNPSSVPIYVHKSISILWLSHHWCISLQHKDWSKIHGSAKASLQITEGKVTLLWRGPDVGRLWKFVPLSLSHTSFREIIFCSLSFGQGHSLGSVVVRKCLQHLVLIQPPLDEITAPMSFEGGGGKTQLPPTPKILTLPGCFSAQLLKLQPRDITIVFRFLL